jgi:hypothetical protein
MTLFLQANKLKKTPLAEAACALAAWGTLAHNPREDRAEKITEIDPPTRQFKNNQ